MFDSILRVIVPGILLAQVVSAQTADQPVVRLKTRTVTLDQRVEKARMAAASGLAAGHLILQFNESPAAEVIDALNSRGVKVLADVPDNALLVSSSGFANVDDLGVRMAFALNPEDKISPLFADANAWSR